MKRQSLKEQTREYWMRFVYELQQISQQNYSKDQIYPHDYSLVLPTQLKKRVKEIVPYEYSKEDLEIFLEKEYLEQGDEGAQLRAYECADSEQDRMQNDDGSPVYRRPEDKKKTRTHFNESTCSEILRLDDEYPKFELKLTTVEPMKAVDKKPTKKKPKNNWYSKYVCKTRCDRVKWDTKIYKKQTEINEKSLDDQALQLMEASAERFTDWLNGLGSNHEFDIDKSHVIRLFSIEADRKLLRAIRTDPIEVKAIAKTVADKWNLPQMAIELKYDTLVNKRFKQAGLPKPPIQAFGRTINYKDRSWVPITTEQKIETCFPNELLSGEKLFKGIGHLRSTKSLVEYLRKHPKVDKPEYLVKNGFFSKKSKSRRSMELPLYDRLKLKY